MCLNDIITDVEPITEGYKIYRRLNKDKLIPEYFGSPIKIGKWYNSSSSLIRRLLFGKYIQTGNGKKYEQGFHVFHNLENAKYYRKWSYPQGIIVKVMIKNPICVGLQISFTPNDFVTVARQIKVIEIIKE